MTSNRLSRRLNVRPSSNLFLGVFALPNLIRFEPTSRSAYTLPIGDLQHMMLCRAAGVSRDHSPRAQTGSSIAIGTPAPRDAWIPYRRPDARPLRGRTRTH